MTIRPATQEDIPAIVDLLKVSLGESLMPKSEEFWRWKHIENPFGPSPVLLAYEENQLIGVRAFMRWEWQHGNNIIKAVRAVDTATHPDHQGKGIFKKLTLQLVEQCKDEGIHFIFNTPNKKSKPGYLKMGWKEVGKLPISITPVLPSYSLKSEGYQFSEVKPDCEFIFSNEPTDSFALITHYNNAFLKWRYALNPNVRYYSLQDDDRSYQVIYRIKKTRLGRELRICDVHINKRIRDQKEIKNKLLFIARKARARFISIAGDSLLSNFQFKLGPMVTVRPLTSDYSLTFDQWKPSLGDMEVF